MGLEWIKAEGLPDGLEGLEVGTWTSLVVDTVDTWVRFSASSWFLFSSRLGKGNILLRFFTGNEKIMNKKNMFKRTNPHLKKNKKCLINRFFFQVRTFWETYKIWKNLPHGFDKSADLLSKRKNHEEDFFKLCVLLKKSKRMAFWCCHEKKSHERANLYNQVPSLSLSRWRTLALLKIYILCSIY